MNNLNKQDLLSIGIKLLALYLLLTWVMQLPSVIIIVANYFIQSLTLSDKLLFSLVPLLLSLLSLLVPLFLWRLSDRIAQWAIKSNHAVMVNDSDSLSLQAMLFCVVGLFIFLTALPQLIQWIVQYIMFVVRSTPVYMAPHAPMPFHWISLVLQVGLGLAVMLKSKGLAVVIHKLRYAGSKDST